jgi:hypothetical protein
LAPDPSDDGEVLRLERRHGSWPEDDRDAAFKQEVASFGLLDPMQTLRGLSEYSGIPPGALARYVLAKWASAGNAGLLELGPSMVEQLWQHVADAEAIGTDDARLAAYHALRGRLSWLQAPLGDEGAAGP